MGATPFKAICDLVHDVVFVFDKMAGICPHHLISSLNSPFLQWFNDHECSTTLLDNFSRTSLISGVIILWFISKYTWFKSTY
jgi:hypothetical protein